MLGRPGEPTGSSSDGASCRQAATTACSLGDHPRRDQDREHRRSRL